MDELLIKYCKKNGYIYIDYSNKFVKFNEETVNKIEDLMNKKRFDDKYAKIIYRINFEKVNKKFVKVFEEFLECENIKNKSLFISRYSTFTHRNDILLNDFSIKRIFIENEETCCICLEKFEHRRVSCCHCSAIYHYECISNSKYSYVEDNKTFCCICKNQM